MTADILCRAKRRTVFIPRNGAELRAYAQCEIDPIAKQISADLRLHGRISPAHKRAFEGAYARVRASMAAMLGIDEDELPGGAA